LAAICPVFNENNHGIVYNLIPVLLNPSVAEATPYTTVPVTHHQT